MSSSSRLRCEHIPSVGTQSRRGDGDIPSVGANQSGAGMGIYLLEGAEADSLACNASRAKGERSGRKWELERG
eukprot:5474406-Pyramimonas_sp.AAC.1